MRFRVLSLSVAVILSGCGADLEQPVSSPLTLRATSSKSASQVATTADDYGDVVQQLYVGYFGRPADVGGFDYYKKQYLAAGAPTTVTGVSQAYSSNPAIRALVDSFSTSAESQALYAGDNRQFVEAIYRNLFNRGADDAGRTYWANTIDSGALTRSNAAISIMAGAQSTDAEIIRRKTVTARNFTSSLDTQQEASAYGGMTANASVRRMLALVSDTTDTEQFKARIDQTVLGLVSGLAAQPAPVTGGVPGAAAMLSLTADNIINAATFNNYFKYFAVAGERLVFRANLATPMSDQEKTRCASSPGTGTTASSYQTQIHIYDMAMKRVGGQCGEDLIYSFNQTGTYTVHVDFPSRAGLLQANAIVGAEPVQFESKGLGTPSSPYKLELLTANVLVSNPFKNYYWVWLEKGERLQVNALLNQPMSTTQKTRCASNPGYNTQIIIYDAKLERVGLVCGESITFQATASGYYVINFNYGSQSAGRFNAAKF